MILKPPFSSSERSDTELWTEDIDNTYVSTLYEEAPLYRDTLASRKLAFSSLRRCTTPRQKTSSGARTSTGKTLAGN